jgi:two-component system sensor histidine kinase DevS
MRTDAPFSDEALRRALDAAPDGIAVVDESGTVVFVNPMVEQLFGYSHDELVGRSVDVLLPDALRGTHAGKRGEYAVRPRARSMGSGLDLNGRKKSGEQFPLEISLSPLRTDDGLLVVVIIRDVTERRSADRELQRVRDELALVDDRERIARDLHDNVIQRLFAVGLSLQGAITRAASDPAVDRIRRAVDDIDATIRDIRSSIFALHTRRPLGESLRDDLLLVAREAGRALGFEPVVRFDGPVDSAISNEIREQLLATLREALSNVTKHASAAAVTIELAVDGREVCLVVRDNGVGMANSGTGNGLRNLRERALAYGGECVISAPESGGTQIAWRVAVGTSD